MKGILLLLFCCCSPSLANTGCGGDDALSSWLSRASTSRPNVLFLVIDDLSTELGCYGKSHMVTPNIDQLASKSVRFDRVYAQQAMCTASRSSFLTSRRPDSTRVYDLRTYWRTAGGNFTTLPQYFKEHGYVTVSSGKIFHPGGSAGGNNDRTYSWTADYKGEADQDFKSMSSSLQAVDVSEVGDLVDMNVADYSVDFLDNFATQNDDQPFFLAVGFRKPHLPFRYPREYDALYPLDSIGLASHNTKPPNLPRVAWSSFAELRNYEDIKAFGLSSPFGLIPDDYQPNLRQGYYSSVSYIDAQVGRVLSALDQNGLSNNTIVVLTSDHGFQLGENGEWCKHTNFDIALRVPLLVSVPGVTSSDHHYPFLDPLATLAGNDDHRTTKELVELVDIFPTMAELSGLAVPETCPDDARDVLVCTEGTSLVPLVRHVRSSRCPSVQWKKAAFSQYPRYNNQVMGYTVRTDKYRYTEWVSFDTDNFQPDFSSVRARELYDEDTDPEEFYNMANNATFRAVRNSLSRQLRAGWRTTLQDYLQASGQSS